jgi:membrane-anchored glycerophosphoryl diester phosphodiesterase (GDPDase)
MKKKIFFCIFCPKLKLMRSKTFSPVEAISLGWQTFKKNALFSVMVVLLLVVFLALLELIKFLGSAGQIVASLLEILLGLFVVGFSIKLSKGESANLEEILSWSVTPRKFLHYLAYSLLITVFIIGLIIILFLISAGSGFSFDLHEMPVGEGQMISRTFAFWSIFLLIVFVYLLIRLMFVTYLIVDKDLGFIDAIKGSWQMTAGNFWSLLGLSLLNGLIVFIGILAILLGLFVALPVVMFSQAHAYLALLPGEEETQAEETGIV